ncbi:MAG TPA: hypothetical protein DCS93_18790, partial [Microscillaceae bacterium]|nr:hypothetical protein [Microscillaceae bacterium]
MKKIIYTLSFLLLAVGLMPTQATPLDSLFEKKVAEGVQQLTKIFKQNAWNDAQGFSHKNQYVFGDLEWLGIEDDKYLGSQDNARKINNLLVAYNKLYKIKLYLYIGGYSPVFVEKKIEHTSLRAYEEYKNTISKLTNPTSTAQAIFNRIRNTSFWKDQYSLAIGIRTRITSKSIASNDEGLLNPVKLTGASVVVYNKKLKEKALPFGEEVSKIVAKYRHSIFKTFSSTNSQSERTAQLVDMVNELTGVLINYDPNELDKIQSIEGVTLASELEWDMNSRAFTNASVRFKELATRKQGSNKPYEDEEFGKANQGRQIIIADYVGLQKGFGLSTDDEKAKLFIALAKVIKVSITNTTTDPSIMDFLSKGLYKKYVSPEEGYKDFADFASLGSDEMMLWVHFDADGQRQIRFWFGMGVQQYALRKLNQELIDFYLGFYDGRLFLECLDEIKKFSTLLSSGLESIKTTEEFRKLIWLNCDEGSEACKALKQVMTIALAAYDGALDEGVGMIQSVENTIDAIAFTIHFLRNDENVRDQMLAEIQALDLKDLTLEDLKEIGKEMALGTLEGFFSEVIENYDLMEQAASDLDKTYYAGKMTVALIAIINPFSKGRKIAEFLKEFKESIQKVIARKKRRKNKGKKPKLTVDKIGNSYKATVVGYVNGGKKKTEKVGKGEIRSIDGKILLEISELEAKFKIGKNRVISAIVRKSKDEDGLYIKQKKSLAKAMTVGKWALNKRYNAIKAGDGTMFVKDAYMVEEQADKKSWKVFRSKDDPTLLAIGEYKIDQKALKISLEENANQEQEEVLDALWEKGVKSNVSRPVNLIYTTLQKDKDKFSHLTGNESQEQLDDIGQTTSIGQWAMKVKAFKYTLLSYNNNTVKQVRFMKTACFVAGTKVWLSNYSQVNIETLKKGQLVRAFDTYTGQETIGEINHTIIKQASTLVKIYTALDTLLVTPEHPFFIDGEWIEAGRLKKGYKLTLLDHRNLLATQSSHLPRSTEVSIDSIALKDTLVRVYNFTVTKYNTYYVGNSGLLVHNSTSLCPIETVKDNGLTYKVYRDVNTGSIRVKYEQAKDKLKPVGRGGIKNGLAEVELKLKNPTTGTKWDERLRGSFILKKILDTEIERYHKKLSRFKSTWVKKLPENLDMFNQGLKEGLTEYEAANNTWTGDWLWKNYSLACTNNNDVDIKASTTDVSGIKVAERVIAFFKKSSERPTGLYIEKVNSQLLAYASKKKEKILGKGTYYPSEKALRITIDEEKGKRRVFAICDGLIKKIKENSTQKIVRVFTTESKYLQEIPAYMVRRRYYRADQEKELKKYVTNKKVRISQWALNSRNGYQYVSVRKENNKATAIYFSKIDDHQPQTLVHYTDRESYKGILSTKKLYPSTKDGHTKFDKGQYFGDIFPSDIGGYSSRNLSLSQKNEGVLSSRQVATTYWGRSTATRFMSHFVEIDVTGLKIKKEGKGKYYIYLKEGTSNLDVSTRIINDGRTPYCTPHITKIVSSREEAWRVYTPGTTGDPKINARYILLGDDKDIGVLYIDEIKEPLKEPNLKKFWLTELYRAVESNRLPNEDQDNAPVKRDISVIVGTPATGVDMSKFRSIKSQSIIDAEGQKTLVGSWAAGIILNSVPHQYKHTIIRNTHLRFSKTECFVAGTQVWLSDYRRMNIEQVKKGQFVRAFDINIGQETIGKVKQTMVKEATKLVKIYTITDTLLVTPEHPFYINKRWLNAGKLKKGDTLTSFSHQDLLATQSPFLENHSTIIIDSVSLKDTLVKVYNFTVDKYHNYYVGNTGALVHNNCFFTINTSGLRDLNVVEEFLGDEQKGSFFNFSIKEDTKRGGYKVVFDSYNPDIKQHHRRDGFDYIVTNDGTLEIGEGHKFMA